MGLKIGTLREIGAKKGDVVTFDENVQYRFTVDKIERGAVFGRAVDGDNSYNDSWFLDGADNWRIVQPDAPTGPVRTVTRKEIVPGVYGCVNLGAVHGDSAQILLQNPGFLKTCYTAAELRAAIDTLTEIADALEDQ